MEFNINEEYLGGERKDTLSKEIIAIKIANLCSYESKDPSTQVGACIINNNKIISTGFNHNPNEWDSTIFPWRNDVNNIGYENTKYPYIFHAELDAISNCDKREKLNDSTIYVTLFPCIQCAKMIVAFGIKKVVYQEYRESLESTCSKRLLEKCGIEIVQANDLENSCDKYERFFRKFDLENLEIFDSILYFSSFSADMKDLVDTLKEAKEKVSKSCFNYKKQDLIQIVRSLDKDELQLFYDLLDEAELSSSSDRRYIEHNIYFGDLKNSVLLELEQKSIIKIKKRISN